MAQALQSTIRQAWEDRASLTSASSPGDVQQAVNHVIAGLNAGTLRVAEKTATGWSVNQWIKQAVLLSFHLAENAASGNSPLHFYDKVATKFDGYDEAAFRAGGFRIVPPATVRRGASIGRDLVLVPSYVNIGGYIDAGSMVDTWATVGSCVQIGKNVHLFGGVGIGGVLEPLQASPTTIKDNGFIGARSEVVESVIVERGSLPAPDGSHSLACAVIVKRVDARTRAKTSVNELLRA